MVEIEIEIKILSSVSEDLEKRVEHKEEGNSEMVNRRDWWIDELELSPLIDSYKILFTFCGKMKNDNNLPWNPRFQLKKEPSMGPTCRREVRFFFFFFSSLLLLLLLLLFSSIFNHLLFTSVSNLPFPSHAHCLFVYFIWKN